eukprot:TRINITY_DN29911_c0_g1_i1.p1 TRINITY_DN29911_c0_g1~~TRINITY_DN29911_c0_g1_i1.p1  ORF type:complete len:263 (+),score=68.86 TRINITY_DN29911_c0_g1_i1:334-1122(+)
MDKAELRDLIFKVAGVALPRPSQPVRTSPPRAIDPTLLAAIGLSPDSPKQGSKCGPRGSPASVAQDELIDQIYIVFTLADRGSKHYLVRSDFEELFEICGADNASYAIDAMNNFFWPSTIGVSRRVSFAEFFRYGTACPDMVKAVHARLRGSGCAMYSDKQNALPSGSAASTSGSTHYPGGTKAPAPSDGHWDTTGVGGSPIGRGSPGRLHKAVPREPTAGCGAEWTSGGGKCWQKQGVSEQKAPESPRGDGEPVSGTGRPN